LLRHATFILLSPNSDDSWIEYAKKLFNRFISLSKEIYGPEFSVYNVHCLEHITDDYKLYGQLNNYSAFDFENYMQSLKRMLRSKSMQLQQIVKRCAEIERHKNVTQSCKKPLKNTLFINNICVSNSIRDNCYLTNSGKIVVIVKILAKTFECKVFKQVSSYYNFPCESSLLYINKVSRLSKVVVMNYKELHRKCILIPENEYFVAIAMANGHLQSM